MVVNCLNFGERVFDVLFVKELLFGGSLADFYEIKKNVVIDALCWMSHVHFALKICLFSEVGKASTVVYVKVSDQQQLNLFRVYHVEVG